MTADKKPKIGLLTGGYFEYWRMYPHLEQIVEKEMRQLADGLREKVDVVWSGLADTLEKETLDYAGRVADNYLANPSWVRFCKFSINHAEEAAGLEASLKTAFNNFCLMTTSYSSALSSPDEGGFARTKVARQNLELSRPWLNRANLA